MSGPPVILLRSGWQTVNIGDIAHTPGAVQLINNHIPEAHVILWANRLDRGARELLNRHCPDLEISESPTPEDVLPLIERADLFIAGSGSRFPARQQVAFWREHTDKPYGLLGVTVDEVTDETRPLLDGAAFCYLRETESVRILREAGVASPVIDFGPDATWAMHIADDEAATRRLQKHRLEPGRFICVVPRSRYTPYHQIRPNHGWSDEKIAQIESHNARYVESDAARLRDVIVRWVRETGHRVLLCPEMTYQIELLEPCLYAPLPGGVKPHVSFMDEFWLPDEASSLYARACAVVSCECHSPIMAIVTRTPALYIRQPEDTIKGRMYPDLGLGDWMCEIESSTGEEIADGLMRTHNDLERTQKMIRSALSTAEKRFAEAMRTVRAVLLH